MYRISDDHDMSMNKAYYAYSIYTRQDVIEYLLSKSVLTYL